MFTRWKISTKILFGYVMALIFLLIVGIISLVQLNQINQIVKELTTKTAEDYQTANDIVSGIYAARLYVNRFMRTASEQDYNEYQTRIEKLDKAIATAEKSFNQTEQAKRVTELKQDFLTYKTVLKKW
jgi:CHASE3 domain sensor protein